MKHICLIATLLLIVTFLSVEVLSCSCQEKNVTLFIMTQKDNYLATSKLKTKYPVFVNGMLASYLSSQRRVIRYETTPGDLFLAANVFNVSKYLEAWFEVLPNKTYYIEVTLKNPLPYETFHYLIIDSFALLDESAGKKLFAELGGAL
jgi:hypothetical protein